MIDACSERLIEYLLIAIIDNNNNNNNNNKINNGK